MTRYAVFLRGINVGGNNKIAMADLRALVSGLGYTDVKTHLQSGNVVLSAEDQQPDDVVRAVEAALASDLQVPVRCLARTAAEMRAIVDGDPFTGVATEGSRYLVVFLSEVPDPVKVATLNPADYAPEEFRIIGREAYLWHPEGIRDAKMNKIDWQRRLGLVVSARNWNTVTKIADMLDA